MSECKHSRPACDGCYQAPATFLDKYSAMPKTSDDEKEILRLASLVGTDAKDPEQKLLQAINAKYIRRDAAKQEVNSEYVRGYQAGRAGIQPDVAAKARLDEWELIADASGLNKRHHPQAYNVHLPIAFAKERIAVARRELGLEEKS